MAYIILNNNGDKAVNYSLGINIVSETGSVNIGGEEFKLSDYLEFGFISTGSVMYENDADTIADLSNTNVVNSGVSKSDTLEAGASTDLVAVVVYLPQACIDKVTVKEGEKLPEIALGLTVLVTQPMGGNTNEDGDGEGGDPVEPDGFTASTSITDVVIDGVLSSTVTIGEGQSIGAFLPEGVKLEEGATEVTLNVANTNRSSNINMTSGELSKSLDVHIDGIALDNDVPVAINLGPVFPVGYNTANIRLYHVENGEAIEMELVDEFTAHNQFVYIPETGEVIIYIASFSEITAVFTANDRWDGTRDYSWYDPNATELYIENAAQLAGFGAIVGGMAEGIEQDSFFGKTVYLSADIVIGDLTDEDGRDVVFYPIGYYNSEGTYEKTGTAITSGFRNFEGTFDGQGYTISDWYQNTWEMKGDHNWYDASLQYYRDGMGLFGKVYKGTVKNLVVRNFSSDGEITTTGTIAAYADGAHFENIRIYNCNPRVYNIGNGGIVGVVGWYAKEAGLQTTFKNITVDKSNKISALWGSWDVSCGGIVGQYYDFSGQSSAGKPENGGIYMEDCISAAVIDVYNDVCGNYQYYQYRYAGMLVGTLGSDTAPASDHIEFKNVKVYIGNWADYYYCEFEKNSVGSYTEDYQSSRVEKNEINIDPTTNLPYTENLSPCRHQHTAKELEGNKNMGLYLPFNQLYTGYGWGSSPVKTSDGVEIIHYFYTVTYMDGEGKNILDTVYVTDGERSETKLWSDTHTVKKESITRLKEENLFAGWVGSNSQRVEYIKSGNYNDVLLYESWNNPYVIRFVDIDGNVIYSESWTTSNQGLAYTPSAPPQIDGYVGSWEEGWQDKLLNVASDVTINPVYVLEEYANKDDHVYVDDITDAKALFLALEQGKSVIMGTNIAGSGTQMGIKGSTDQAAVIGGKNTAIDSRLNLNSFELHCTFDHQAAKQWHVFDILNNGKLTLSNGVVGDGKLVITFDNVKKDAVYLFNIEQGGTLVLEAGVIIEIYCPKDKIENVYGFVLDGKKESFANYNGIFVDRKPDEGKITITVGVTTTISSSGIVQQ